MLKPGLILLLMNFFIILIEKMGSSSLGIRNAEGTTFLSIERKYIVKLLVLLGRCSQPRKTQQLFDVMIEEGLQPTTEFYTALVGAYCRSNILDKAFTILH